MECPSRGNGRGTSDHRPNRTGRMCDACCKLSVQTPELRTRFAQALKHSEELVGVARRLPGVVISAQSAASSASRRGNDIKRAVDAAFERGGLHDSSDASESSYRGDPSSNNTTDIAYDAALYSTRDELPLHSVRTESGPPFSTMATAPGLSRPPDNISLSTSAAAFNPPHYSTTNYYTPAAPADGTFTRTHQAAYLASVLPGEPVPTPRGLHVIAAERYTFAETNAAAVLESTTVIGSHSIHAEAVADAALTAASTEMLVSSSPLSSASSSQSMTDLLTPSRVLSDHGAEQEPPISGTAAAAAVAGKGPLISESAAVAVDAAAAATFVSPPTQPRRREFRERSVPASSIARAWGFGSLAASLALGAASDAVRAALRGAPAPQKPTPISSVAGSGATPLDSTSPSMAARSEASEVASDEATATVRAGDAATSSSASSGSGAHPHVISEAQAERLAEGLCRMRGAALKLGQMLSIADESVLPPAVAAVLERVRTQADVMPRRQLERVMAAELGADWRVRLGETSSGGGFVATPIAAASIGQVHYSVLADGRPVAVKVQYPGVGDSIHSDLDNLQRLLVFSDVLPKGLYLDAMVEVAREELSHECDYVREADAQERFKALVGDDPDFVVPSVIRELSTKRILVSTWLEGMAIDQVVERGYPQAVRDRIARKLLKLTLKELFEWRFMQVRACCCMMYFARKCDCVRACCVMILRMVRCLEDVDLKRVKEVYTITMTIKTYAVSRSNRVVRFAVLPLTIHVSFASSTTVPLPTFAPPAK